MVVGPVLNGEVRAAIILLARNNSRRLPGKSTLKVNGKTLIEHQITRLRPPGGTLPLVLATTANDVDEPLCRIAEDAGVPYYRGSELDVVERLQQVSRHFGLEFVVCVGGDDIFCEMDQAEQLIIAYTRTRADFIVLGGVPLGATPYGVRSVALGELMALKGNGTSDGWERYFLETGRFRVVELPVAEPNPVVESLRLTLDYPEDFELVKTVYDRLGKGGAEPALSDIVKLLTEKAPELAGINRDMHEKWEGARPDIQLGVHRSN